MLILGVNMCMTGRFTVGMVMAFQGFLGSFMQPAQTLISAGQKFQELRTEMERVEDVMKYPTDVEIDEEVDEDEDYEKLSGTVELKNVTFGYSRLSPPLIENFSMKLESGIRVAFVGASGCGMNVQAAIDVAVDELFANIAHYAYNPETGFATVRVDVLKEPLSVEITFIDNGKQYDPLAKDAPDTTLSLDDRPVGGMGIFIVKKSMDAVNYEYRDGKNIITIKKISKEKPKQ